ncbi:MAG: hypothetical protein ACQER7_04065 [Bacteroidota bacterium]
MKKILFMSIIVFIVTFIINGCNNSDEIDTLETKITNSEICEMHNKIIQDFQDATISKIPSHQKIDKYFDETLKILKTNLKKYDSIRYDTKLNKDLHNRVFSKIISQKSNSKIDFKEYSFAFIKEMKTQNLISNYMFRELNLLCKKALNSSNKEIIYYLHNKFAMNTSTDGEKQQKDLIVKMAESSDKFWNNNPLKSIMLKESSKVIIADAVGALYGSLLGPVGSIVYGAGFSLYQNEVL